MATTRKAQMKTRRNFLKRAGLWIPGAIAFPAILRAQNFSSVAKVASWTAPAATGGEPESPTTDANLWAFYRADVGLTFNGSNVINSSTNAWADQSSNARNAICPGGAIRACNRIAAGVNGKDYVQLLNSLASGLATPSTALAYPFTILILMQQISWLVNRRIFTSATDNNTVACYQSASTPSLTLYSGSVGQSTVGMVLSAWHVLTVVWGGSGTTKLCVDKGSDVTGSTGTAAVSGVCFGGSSGALVPDFNLASVIICTGESSTAQRLKHVNWLAWYGGLTI